MSCIVRSLWITSAEGEARDVQEWHNRVHLFEGDVHTQIQTYTEAVKTVDPNQAVGKPHTLWCAFAHFYERHGDIDNARTVFDKATQVCPPTA
jgi:pre-mRNA-splicing factor SYF1